MNCKVNHGLQLEDRLYLWTMISIELLSAPMTSTLQSCPSKAKTMMYDYLIVGQGIAGSTLAYMLRKKVREFLSSINFPRTVRRRLLQGL